MSVSCPQCGSRFLNCSRSVSARERLNKVLGHEPLRCQDCHTRFLAQTFLWRDLLFAKCPRCYRMDLNTWQARHGRTTGWMVLLLQFGGRRMRCEYCRVNFVSLRKRKEHFTFSRWTRLKQDSAVATNKRG